jgi:hypothetical protein
MTKSFWLGYSCENEKPHLQSLFSLIFTEVNRTVINDSAFKTMNEPERSSTVRPNNMEPGEHCLNWKPCVFVSSINNVELS